MKISIFTSMTNPENEKIHGKKAMDCYKDLEMRLITVGEDWPYEFKFDHIGKTFQKGFDKSNGDWVIQNGLRLFFSEKDLKNIRNFLKSNQDAPA